MSESESEPELDWELNLFGGVFRGLVTSSEIKLFNGFKGLVTSSELTLFEDS